MRVRNVYWSTNLMHTDAVSGADEGSPAGEGAAELSAPGVEAVVLATRLLVAISAQSVAAVDDVVTLPQLRVLVMVSSRGPLNLGAVAAGLGVHPSTRHGRWTGWSGLAC
jgi:hypothetical protein